MENKIKNQSRKTSAPAHNGLREDLTSGFFQDVKVPIILIIKA